MEISNRELDKAERDEVFDDDPVKKTLQIIWKSGNDIVINVCCVKGKFFEET